MNNDLDQDDEQNTAMNNTTSGSALASSSSAAAGADDENENNKSISAVPLIAGRPKKKQVKKPRIRPKKKTTATKRKVNKAKGAGAGPGAGPGAGNTNDGKVDDSSKKQSRVVDSDSNAKNNGKKLKSKSDVSIVSPSPPSQVSNIDKDDGDGDENDNRQTETTLDKAGKDRNTIPKPAADQNIDANIGKDNNGDSNANTTTNNANATKGPKEISPRSSSRISKPAAKATVSSSSRRSSNSIGLRKRKITRGKPIAKSKGKGIGKPIRPTGNPIRAVRNSAISIGSSIQKPSSLQSQRQQRESNAIQSNIDNNINPEEEKRRRNDSNVSQELVPASPSKNNTTTDNTDDNDNEIVPYQHLGQLDPAWNIAPPKEDEKTMKDYCSTYLKKLPPELLKRKNINKENDPNDTNSNNDDDDNTNSNKRRRGNRSSNSNENNETSNKTSTNNNHNNSSSTPSTTKSSSNNEGIPIVEVINGEIVIKETTVIVGERQSIEEVDREMGGTVVVEDSNALTATYRSFKTNEKIIRWSVEETRNFYIAIRQCGTDFTTMMSFFDGSSEDRRKRSRKQLKSKYKLECRKNLKLIDMAMNPKVQLPLDLSKFGELDMENLTTSVTPIVHEESTTTATANAATSNATDQSVITQDEDVNTPFETVFEDEETEKQRQSTLPFGRWDENMNLNGEKDGLGDSSTTRIGISTITNQDKVADTTTSLDEEEEKGEEELTQQIALTIPGGNKKKKKKFRVKPKPGPKGKSKQGKNKSKPKQKKAVK